MVKAMFTIIAAMAELERNVIRERVQAGLDYAGQRHEVGPPHRPAACRVRPRGNRPAA